MKNYKIASRIQKIIISCVLISFLSISAKAQDKKEVIKKDTIHVGINGQIIQVTPPKLNSKIRVTLEDSLVTYQIEIAKLSNQLELKAIPKNEPKESKEGKRAERRKEFQFNYFSEVELGYGLSYVNLRPYPFGYGLRLYAHSVQTSNTHRTLYSLSSINPSRSIYVGMNLRDKTRSFKMLSGKFYSRNTFDVGLTQHSVSARMEGERFELNSTTSESFISEAKVDIYSGSLAKRWILGINLNSQKNMAIELGLALNFSAPILSKLKVNNLPSWSQESLLFHKDITSNWNAQLNSGLEGGLFMGCKYKKLSLNARLYPKFANLPLVTIPNLYMGLAYKL